MALFRRADLSRSSRLRCLVQDEARRLITGVNWSPGIRNPFRSLGVAEPAEGGLDDEGDAVIVIVGDLAVIEALHLAEGSREARFENAPAR